MGKSSIFPILKYILCGDIMKRNFYDFHKAQHFTKKELEDYKDEWVIGDYIARSTVNDDLPADWKIEAIYV